MTFSSNYDEWTQRQWFSLRMTVNEYEQKLLWKHSIGEMTMNGNDVERWKHSIGENEYQRQYFSYIIFHLWCKEVYNQNEHNKKCYKIYHTLEFDRPNRYWHKRRCKNTSKKTISFPAIQHTHFLHCFVVIYPDFNILLLKSVNANRAKGSMIFDSLGCNTIKQMLLFLLFLFSSFLLHLHWIWATTYATNQ